MVEEYFEAHSSSKVLTSDRTLERLHTPKLDRVSIWIPLFQMYLNCCVAAVAWDCILCVQETLVQLLEGKPSCYSKEIQQLHDKHRKHFSKWMLQLQWVGFFCLCLCFLLCQCNVWNICRKLKVSLCLWRLGFSVLLYGLGSKKALMEDFRVTQLAQEIHLVVNGFFPSITLKSVSFSFIPE